MMHGQKNIKLQQPSVLLFFGGG